MSLSFYWTSSPTHTAVWRRNKMCKDFNVNISLTFFWPKNSLNKHLNGRGSITVVPFDERNTMLVVILGFQRFVSRFNTAHAVVLAFASSHYNWEFWPKTAKFGQKYAFVVILGHILVFLAHLVPFPAKNQCDKGAQVVLLLLGYRNFCFLP